MSICVTVCIAWNSTEQLTEVPFCMGNSTERFLREMSWRDGGSLGVHTKARAVVTAGHMGRGGGVRSGRPMRL